MTHGENDSAVATWSYDTCCSANGSAQARCWIKRFLGCSGRESISPADTWQMRRGPFSWCLFHVAPDYLGMGWEMMGRGKVGQLIYPGEQCGRRPDFCPPCSSVSSPAAHSWVLSPLIFLAYVTGRLCVEGSQHSVWFDFRRWWPRLAPPFLSVSQL